MKKLMITGGLAGFLIGIISGCFRNGEWPTVIWRASVGACGAGVLLRWWGGIWLRTLRQNAELLAADAPVEPAHNPNSRPKAER
jgi:hypothetical protein